MRSFRRETLEKCKTRGYEEMILNGSNGAILKWCEVDFNWLGSSGGLL
jgi:hypothetical protein